MGLVAVSDAVLLGLFTFAGTIITTVGLVIVAVLGRDVQRRRRDVKQAAADVTAAADAATVAATDFEQLWAARGRLLDGLGQDLDAAHRRIDEGESREELCQEQLADHRTRIVELEAIVERRKLRG